MMIVASFYGDEIVYRLVCSLILVIERIKSKYDCNAMCSGILRDTRHGVREERRKRDREGWRAEVNEIKAKK